MIKHKNQWADEKRKKHENYTLIPTIPPHPINPDFHWLLEHLYISYLEARKNKRHTVDEQKFEENYLRNLIHLAEDIYTGTYEIGRSIAFVVSSPVYREIFAAEFRDRIVHHFLVFLIGKWWDNRFIHNSFSCRLMRGTDYAQRALLHDIRSQRAETGEAVIVKLDIRGYFMHIGKRMLFKRVAWGLEQEFGPDDWLCQLGKYLARKIIYDCPQNRCVIKGTWEDWKKIPPDKSLFYQPDWRGLPIGNLSSQLFANIYLDVFDRFIKFTLKFQHYGRYVDDFYFVIAPSEVQSFVKLLDSTIEPFLAGMGLTLHPRKRYIQDSHHPVLFVGQYISADFQQPSPRTRRNFNENFARFMRDDYDEQALASSLGNLKKYPKFLARTFRYHGLLYRW
ncbi:hypothetical protein IKE72_01885 [Candidatus Saccharibacteria bacterium]|nr:hypothetical protein [Candidatus Saccharibacteria bacterium]